KRLDVATIDEPQVDDVDRDLGVVAGSQLAPRRRLDGLYRGRRAAAYPEAEFLGRVELQAERIGMPSVDAVEIAVDHHREGAAEPLADVADVPGLQRRRGPPGHRDGRAIAVQRDFLDVAVPVTHCFVLTPSSPVRLRRSARCAACATRASRTSPAPGT